MSKKTRRQEMCTYVRVVKNEAETKHVMRNKINMRYLRYYWAANMFMTQNFVTMN
jgi:hypothetical protein